LIALRRVGRRWTPCPFPIHNRLQDQNVDERREAERGDAQDAWVVIVNQTAGSPEMTVMPGLHGSGPPDVKLVLLDGLAPGMRASMPNAK
jgi:hypothetical protein